MKKIQGCKFYFSLAAFCVLALFAGDNLSAQAVGSWLPGQRPGEVPYIYNAEGGDFVLSRNSRRTVLSSEAMQRGTLMLNPSDLVQTGPGSELEIQLVPSGTVIKLLENTSVVFSGIDTNERFAEFGLLYGRVRVVSGEINYAGIDSVVVRGGGVSARLFDGDMAVAYVQPDGWGLTLRPRFYVHTFRGMVNITPHGMEGRPVAHFGGAQFLSVNAGETLMVEVSEEHTLLERMTIDYSIVELWTSRNFIGFPPIQLPNTMIALQPGRAVPLPIMPPVATPLPTDPPPPLPAMPVQSRKQNLTRNLLMGIGFGLMITSAGFLGVANFFPRDVELENDLRQYNYIAGGVFGVGAVFTFLGILQNPTVSR